MTREEDHSTSGDEEERPQQNLEVGEGDVAVETSSSPPQPSSPPPSSSLKKKTKAPSSATPSLRRKPSSSRVSAADESSLPVVGHFPFRERTRNSKKTYAAVVVVVDDDAPVYLFLIDQFLFSCSRFLSPSTLRQAVIGVAAAAATALLAALFLVRKKRKPPPPPPRVGRAPGVRAAAGTKASPSSAAATKTPSQSALHRRKRAEQASGTGSRCVLLMIAALSSERKEGERESSRFRFHG